MGCHGNIESAAARSIGSVPRSSSAPLDIASHQGLSKFRQIPKRRPFLTGKIMTINIWGTSAALSDTPKPLVHFFVHTNIGGKGMFIAPQQLFNKF